MMKTVLSLGIVRGALAGLAGTAIGVGLTVLGRWAMGMTPWSDGPVFSIAIFVGVFAYLIGTGVFNYWARWAIGRRAAGGRGPPRRPAWTRYFSVDTNHKVIGVQYFVTAMVFLPFAVVLQVIGRLDMTKLFPSFLPHERLRVGHQRPRHCHALHRGAAGASPG